MSELNEARPKSVRGKQAIALIIILAVSITIVGAWSVRSRGRHASERVVWELRRTAQQARAQSDSTQGQLKQARFVLAFMEKTGQGGSASLIGAITSLQAVHEAPASLPTVEDLAASGRLSLIGDDQSRGRLLSLN